MILQITFRTAKKLIGDIETFELLFEALCERDLKNYEETFGAGVYHYQDYAGNEMDAVIELPDGVFVVPPAALEN